MRNFDDVTVRHITSAMRYLHNTKISKIISVSTTKKTGSILQQNDIFSRHYMGEGNYETWNNSQPTASKARPDTKLHKFLSGAKREFQWNLVLLYNGGWTKRRRNANYFARTHCIELSQHRLFYSWIEKEASISRFSFDSESCDAIIWKN